jgi:hypothetical protein
MDSSKQADLEKLARFSFRRMGECSKVVEKYYDAPPFVRGNTALKHAYSWMFVPLSLWPFDISGAVEHLIARLAAGKEADESLLLLVELLGPLPPPQARVAIAEHEKLVSGGNYESLIKVPEKFDAKEEWLGENAELRADWNRIKKNFDVAKYQNPAGIIRRRMTSERNFRPKGWDFSWGKRVDRFRLVFDAFCHKWTLYGMDHDKPLLQKLSINITALGTMIFIPRYWSFDYYRDLKWKVVKHLHECRGVPRQGAKLSTSQAQRREQARAVRRWWNEATKVHLKGEKKNQWVIEKLGLHSQTSERQLRRLMKVT